MASRLPLVRSSIIEPFVNGLKRAGLDPNPILIAVGLKTYISSSVDGFIPTQLWYNFAEEAAREAKDPYFGYGIGVHSAIETIPHLNILKMPRATLVELLTTMVINSHFMATSANYEFGTDGNWAELKTMRTFRPTSQPTQIDAFFYGFMLRIFKLCLDEDWDGTELIAKVSDPETIPRTDAPAAGLQPAPISGAVFRFPALWLIRRTGGGVAQNEMFSGIQLNKSETIVADLREIIQTRLSEPTLSLNAISQETGKSVSTLQRTLARAGTSYRRELDAARASRACDLMAIRSDSIKSIGALVGYPNPISFNKAFLRWKGTTPGGYQKNLLSNFVDKIE